MQRTHGGVGIRQERVASKFRVGFGKAGMGGSAFPALNTPLSKVPKPLTGLVLASNTGHIGLVFLADVAVEFAWVGIAAHSAC